MKVYGKILWWSDQDENGIIVDPKGNEFYFDRSVLKTKKYNTLKRHAIVSFIADAKIKECLCARNVEAIPAAKAQTIQKQLEKQLFASEAT